MNEIVKLIGFYGGIDQDRDEKFLEDGDYISASNLWTEIIESTEKNDMVRLNTLLSSTSEIISIEGVYTFDPAAGRCIKAVVFDDFAYLFLQNLSNLHLMRLEYQPDNTLFQQYLGAYPLSLAPGNRHISAWIMDKSTQLESGNHLLYWVYPGTSPKRIDVNRAIQFVAGNTDPSEAYLTLDDSAYELAVAPHLSTLEWRWSANSQKPKGNLKGDCYRFSVQYEYSSGERSRYGPLSTSARFARNSMNSGSPSVGFSNPNAGTVVVPEIYSFNEIILSVNTGGQDVKKARVAVFVDNDPPLEFAVINVSQLVDQFIEVVYDGQHNSVNIPSFMYQENFSSVPKKCDAGAFIGGVSDQSDVIVLGGNIEDGYPIDKVLNMRIESELIAPYNLPDGGFGINNGNFTYTTISWQIEPGGLVLNLQLEIDLVGEFVAANIGRVFVILFGTTTSSIGSIGEAQVFYRTTITQGDITNGIVSFRNRILAEMTDSGYEEVFASITAIDTANLQFTLLSGPVTGYNLSAAWHDPYTVDIQNKRGDVSDYVIVYYDRAGRELVLRDNVTVEPTEEYFQETGNGGIYTPYDYQIERDFKRRPMFNIYHTPPEGMVAYQIAASYGIKKAAHISQWYNPIALVAPASNGGNLGLTLNRISVIEAYLGLYEEDFLPAPGMVAVNLATGAEYAILAYDESTDLLTIACSSVSEWPFSTAYLEIYVPNTTGNDRIYQAISPVLPILDPLSAGRRHAGYTYNGIGGADQVVPPGAPAPANVRFVNGDVRELSTRFEMANYNYVTGTRNRISELYGRNHLFNSDSDETTDISRYRWSDVFIRNGINGLSSFRPLNLNDLPVNAGPITWMGALGYRFKIFQHDLLTTAYIGRTVTTDADGGNGFLLLKTELFGTIRSSEIITGTKHPESVQVVDNDIYYWDDNRRKFHRDDMNGPSTDPLAGINGLEEELHRFLNTVSPLGTENLIVTGYSDRYGMYIIHPCYHNVVNFLYPRSVYPVVSLFEKGALAYSTKENRWKSFIDWKGDAFFETNVNFGFTNANGVVTAAKGADHMSLNGDTEDYQPATLTFVMNEAKDAIKLFKYIRLYGLGKWIAGSSSLNDSPITIPPSNNSPIGMRSRISEANWEDIEGVRCATFKCDMNDPLFDDEVKALLNGRDLRGDVLIVELSILDISKKCHIDMVRIGANPSKIT